MKLRKANATIAAARRVDHHHFPAPTQRQQPLAELIHHSDRGSQWAADDFQQCLRTWRVTPRMNRKGNPCDNALAERVAVRLRARPSGCVRQAVSLRSAVATLKTECFTGLIPPTRAAARLMIFIYIETFYNRHRRHSAPGYRSALDFEKRMSAPKQNN